MPFGTSLFVSQRGPVKITANLVVTMILPNDVSNGVLGAAFNIVRDGTVTLTNGTQTLVSLAAVLGVDYSVPLTVSVIDPAAEPGLHSYSITITNESIPNTATIDLASVIISAKALPLAAASATVPSFFGIQEHPARGTSAITLAPSQSATRNLLVLLPTVTTNAMTLAGCPTTTCVAQCVAVGGGTTSYPSNIPVRLEFNANLFVPAGASSGAVMLDIDILRPDATSVTNGPQRLGQFTTFGTATEFNVSFFVTDEQSTTISNSAATQSLTKSIVYTLVLTNTVASAGTFDVDFFSFIAETSTSPWSLVNRPSTLFTLSSLPSSISSSFFSIYAALPCPWTIGPFVQYFPPDEQSPVAIPQNGSLSLNLTQVNTCGCHGMGLPATRNGTFTSGCGAKPVRLIANLNLYGDVAHDLILYDFQRDSVSLINGMQLLAKGIAEVPIQSNDALQFSCMCVDTNPPPGQHDYRLLLVNLGLGALFVDYGSFMIDA